MNVLRLLLGPIVDRVIGRPPIKKLLARGLDLGSNVSIQNGVIIDESHCWLIKIGNDCTLAPRVHILAHDASLKRHLGYTRIGRVVIGNKTFLGAGTIVLPGVRIGNKVIVGAGSVVSRDIPDGVVAVGNPARVICTLEDYLKKHSDLMRNRPNYPSSGWTLNQGITHRRKTEMAAALDDGPGYVE